MTTHAFHQFALAAAEVAHSIKDLAASDREPLEARIAQAGVMFVVGEHVDAYRELRHVGYAAERIERERGTAQAPLRSLACVAGL